MFGLPNDDWSDNFPCGFSVKKQNKIIKKEISIILLEKIVDVLVAAQNFIGENEISDDIEEVVRDVENIISNEPMLE